MKKCMIGLVLIVLGASVVHAQDNATKNNKWQFEITPYFLAAAMNGKVGVGPVETDIDMSFEDIWDNLDLGLMGAFEARKGAQIGVLILPTTQPETVEQYAVRVVNKMTNPLARKQENYTA